MTEQTPEQVAELIAKARDLIAHTRTYNFGMWSADKLAHEVAGKLADALEATLREMHARELHHFEEEQARAKAEAERDEAWRWAETMQAQKFEWESKEAAVRAERDRYRAAIEEALAFESILPAIATVPYRILTAALDETKED